MDRREPSSTATKPTSYLALIGVDVAFDQPLSGSVAVRQYSGLSFGIFISIWMGLGLHLTSPEMGYGVDTVGYLALLAIVNVVTTPRFGALADRMGPRKTRLIASGFRLVGISLFLAFGHSLWLLIIPILIANIFGPVMDVTGPHDHPEGISRDPHTADDGLYRLHVPRRRRRELGRDYRLRSVGLVWERDPCCLAFRNRQRAQRHSVFAV